MKRSERLRKWEVQGQRPVSLRHFHRTAIAATTAPMSVSSREPVTPQTIPVTNATGMMQIARTAARVIPKYLYYFLEFVSIAELGDYAFRNLWIV